MIVQAAACLKCVIIYLIVIAEKETAVIPLANNWKCVDDENPVT